MLRIKILCNIQRKCIIFIFLCRDFNLEKKIEALPSLSLEEFQEKKKQQRTKKKKIVQKLTSTSNNKRHQNNFDSNDQANSQNNTKISQTERENSEDAEKLLVGSQKRKARKQSITRNAAAINDSKQIEIEEPNKCKYRRNKLYCLFLTFILLLSVLFINITEIFLVNFSDWNVIIFMKEKLIKIALSFI